MGGVPAQGVYILGLYLPVGCTCRGVPVWGMYLPGGYLPWGVPDWGCTWEFDGIRKVGTLFYNDRETFAVFVQSFTLLKLFHKSVDSSLHVEMMQV